MASFSAGPESLEVGLFPWDRIPWNDIAFPSVHWALRAWRSGGANADLGAPARNPSGDPRGIHPMVPPVVSGTGEEGL
jgi:hypothetical protein